MNRRALAWLAALALCACLPGCRTNFTGSPQYPGGAPACFRQCAAENMRMAQFVYVGAYSSACVCEIVPIPTSGARAATFDQRSGASGATTAAAVGVMTQMQDDEDRR